MSRWINAEKSEEASYYSLKLAADIDYVAFLSLWELGLIPSSTHIWTATHCIEKYCKSLLLKHQPNTNIKSYNHGIRTLWDDTKPFLNQIEDCLILDEFIQSLNTVKTPVRYGQCGVFIGIDFSGLFIILGAMLRQEIVGSDEYKTNYGLFPSLFLPRFGTRGINQELKIKKILHLALNHHISFSISSIPDQLRENIQTMGLINDDQFKSCPWCNGYMQIGQAATLVLREFLEAKE